MYFQRVDISPVKVEIDYKPKGINFANVADGNYVELLNLFSFENVKLTIRSQQLTAVNGAQNVVSQALAQWVSQVIDTQLPKIATGLAPLHSIVRIGSRLVDLITLPVNNQ